MAQPTINLCGIKCLIKIIITLVIIIAIIVAAVLIVGNMSLAKLKLDTVKLGEITLADLGLSEMSLKSVLKAAYKLGTAKEADFVTNPFTDADKTAANTLFASLPKTADGTPLYETLLVQKATFADNSLHTLSDKSLAHVYNQVFAGDAIPAEFKKLGLTVGSVTIDNTSMKLTVTFVMDVSSITAGLKKLPFMEWPQKAYLQYTANIAVSETGVFDATDPLYTINGLDEASTKALLTAASTSAKVSLPEGKTIDDMIIETIDSVTTQVVANIGIVCGVTIDANGTATVVTANNQGISTGAITFINH